MIWIRDAVPEDVVRIMEMELTEDPRHLERFFNKSIAVWVGGKDSEIACMYGLIANSLLGDSAYLWLLVTPIVDEYPFIFVRHSQVEVRKMLKVYPIIRGHVLQNNERAIRWLKWLGVRLIGHEQNMLCFELRAS